MNADRNIRDFINYEDTKHMLFSLYPLIRRGSKLVEQLDVFKEIIDDYESMISAGNALIANYNALMTASV